MSLSPIRLIAATASLLPFLGAAQTSQLAILTEKGMIYKSATAHPLSWWTEDPLRLDASGDLMIGFKAKDGHTISQHDFETKLQVLPIGNLAGYKILEVRTEILSGPDLVAKGSVPSGQPLVIWKDLLVSSDGGLTFTEIYAVRDDDSSLMKLTSPAIYGSGENAILGTYDPDTGNGGGCDDGYWWFDKSGPHPVDFSLLFAAVSKAIPKNATFTGNCWALDPQHSQLRTVAQKADAECHACGILGEIEATYRVDHGVARPVHVVFTPREPQ